MYSWQAHRASAPLAENGRRSTGSMGSPFISRSSLAEASSFSGETVVESRSNAFSFTNRNNSRRTRSLTLENRNELNHYFARNSDPSSCNVLRSLPEFRNSFRANVHSAEFEALSPTPIGVSQQSSHLPEYSELNPIMIAFFAINPSFHTVTFLHALKDFATVFDSLVSLRRDLVMVAYFSELSPGEILTNVCQCLGVSKQMISLMNSFTPSHFFSIHESIQWVNLMWSYT